MSVEIPPVGQVPTDAPAAPAVETPAAQPSEEALRLAAIGRGEEPAPAPVASTAERPADVPEKFWDSEKGAVNQDALLKSYLELEKARGQVPQEPAEEPTADPVAEPAPEPAADENPAPDVLPAELFTSARDEWAQTGDLSEETRASIIEKGIPADVLDIYLSGVKALQAQLEAQVFAAAGGEENYRGAISWAQQNWDQTRIDAFNTALDNPGLRDTAIKGLLAEAATAPTEGRLTVPGFSTDGAGTYSHKDQFLKDLAEADAKNDVQARREAVQKLERSKKAGTIQGVTPRSGLAALRR